MSSEEENVHAAVLRFYDALEKLITGQGLGPMEEVWDHSPDVSSGHPAGDWAHGWDEVLATWDVFASLGKPEISGSQIHGVKVHVYGDVAYTTGVFVASPAFGGSTLNVTNVLRRVNGAWKIVHHHADKAPPIGAMLETMAGG